MNGKVWKSIIGLDKDEFIPGLKRLTDAIHRHDVRVAAQLLHAGRSASSFFTKMQPVAPSAVAYRSIKEEPRALTIPEIKKVIDNYVSATLRAKRAVLMPWSFMVEWDISLINSSRMPPINAMMNTVAALKIGLVLQGKWFLR